MTHKLLLLPGDGIGPEIVCQAERVIQTLGRTHGLSVELETALIGGAAYEAEGDPLPEQTLALAQASDAVLFGSVGGPQWDAIERDKRPERGLLRIRAGLDLFANLRPASLVPELAEASSLRPELVAGLVAVLETCFPKRREAIQHLRVRQTATSTRVATPCTWLQSIVYHEDCDETLASCSSPRTCRGT